MFGRDDGDCTDRFNGAGEEALRDCDRSICPVAAQDFAFDSASISSCTAGCFSASCDWSRGLCTSARAAIAACPLFDAAALASIQIAQRRASLVFVYGGPSRCALIDQSPRPCKSFFYSVLPAPFNAPFVKSIRTALLQL